jgi:tetratricopeptide (TPR) repeat protein
VDLEALGPFLADMAADAERFKQAEHLWVEGDVRAAIDAYMNLLRARQEADVRLQSALALVERLKLIDHSQVISEACACGVDAAEALNEIGTQAYLLAKRAECLTVIDGIAAHSRKRLNMAPGWLAFALERDKVAYEELTKQIELNDREAEGLIARALRLAPDDTVLGHVLCSRAMMAFQRFFSIKLDRLPSRLSTPAWTRKLLGRLRK